MTAPGPDDTTRRLTTAATATGGTRPQLAFSLANSDLSETEITAVGGFAQALQLASAHNLAQDSGAKMNYSAQQRALLSGIGVHADAEITDDSRSPFEKAVGWFGDAISNTGSWLFDNPVTHALGWAGKELGNLIHYPFRLLSDGIDQGNNGEVDREMKADGYDPNSTTSYLAFMWNQGENLYHDLSGIRDHYGDDLVDELVQYQRDPEAFTADLEKQSPEEQKKVQDRLNSPEAIKAADLIDRQHISPGRDLARILTLGHTDNAAFTAISGTLDAAYTWFADPTIILGKANAAIKTFDVLGRDIEGAKGIGGLARRAVANTPYLANKRAGVQGIMDQAGIDAVLRTDPVTGKAVTKVGKAWESYLRDADTLVKAKDAAKAATTAEERAQALAHAGGIFRAMDRRYGPLMGMLDEITGTRVIADVSKEGDRIGGIADNAAAGASPVSFPTNKSPITDLKTLRDYLGSTAGLLRMGGGEPARRAIVMPGRLSLWAESKAAEQTRAARRSEKKALIFDYSKPEQMLPIDAEAPLLTTDGLAARGDAQFEAIRKSSLVSARAARARWERINRRLTTTIPNVTRINLNDGGSAKLVEQVARTYLNKGDSAMLAAQFSLGNVAERRQVVKGVLNQLFHASGLSRSEDGIEFMQKYLGEFDDIDRQMYGLNGTSKIVDPVSGQQVEAAILPSQLSTDVLIPSMRQMNKIAAKAAASGFSRRTGLAAFHQLGQSGLMDSMLGTVKLGWITTFAGGLRNALDEVANIAAYGLGRDALTARATFTKATADLRARRRLASRNYLDDVKQFGRPAAERRLGEQIGKAHVNYAEATRALDVARRGEQDLAEAEHVFGWRLGKARDRVSAADDAVREARLRVKSTSQVDDVATQTALNNQLQDALAEQRAAMEDLAKRKAQPAPAPGDATARVQARHEADGVLSVADAEKQLARATEERRRAQVLETVIEHRIPYQFRRVADTLNDVFIGAALGKAMSVFGRKYLIDEKAVQFASELTDRELTQTVRDSLFQAHYWDSGVDDRVAQMLHEKGFKARSYEFGKIYKGYGQVDLDGGAGVDAWAKMLGLAFQDSASPAHAWLDVIHRMYRPEASEGTAATKFGGKIDLTVAKRSDPVPPAAQFQLEKVGKGEWRVLRGEGEHVGSYPTKKAATEGMSEARKADLAARRKARTYSWHVKRGDEVLASYKTKADALKAVPGHQETLLAQDLKQGKAAGDPFADVRNADAFTHGEANTHHYNNAYDRRLMQFMDEHGREPNAAHEYDLIHYDALDRMQRQEGAWNPKPGDSHDLADAEALRTRLGIEAPKATPNVDLSTHAAPAGVDATALQSARDAVRAYIESPAMDHFRRSAVRFQQTRAGIPATTEALKAQTMDEYADDLSAHLIYALSGPAGKDGVRRFNAELLDKLDEAKVTGQTPDISWLSQIPQRERPEKVIAKQWAPYNPIHVPDGMPMGYTRMLSRGYDVMVTKPINALSRNPLFTALYINARRNTADYEKALVDAGWSEQSAEEVAKRISIRHAETETLKHIDNPYVQSQASLIARNYATFIRAQEDWLRRWGRTIKDNPQVIRQAQLLLAGGDSAGFIEQDENGNATFLYPGGALGSQIIDKFFGANGKSTPARIPIAGELSSKVMFLNPSLDNPVGLTGTPLLSIPFGILTSLLGPDHAVLKSSLDKAMNGQLGAGRSWIEKLLPSWANRIYSAFGSDEDTASPYGQAYTETLSQMEAAGMLDDPYYQTQTGQADLRHQVHVGVRNNLIWKALFGLFAPAAPSLTIGADGTLPHDDVPYGSGVKADWVYHKEGLTNLKDEARQLADRVGYEQARQIWTATHPGELIYFDSARTKINTASATAPASLAAATFIQNNQDFFTKYGGPGGVAAYFIPQGKFGTTNGEFSDVAYQAQLEAGLREYKPLSEYFTDVLTSRGARDYYDQKDKFDALKAEADKSGNTRLAQHYDDEWQVERQKIMDANPLLLKRFSDYAVDNAGKQLALGQLAELIRDKSPQVVKALGPNRAGLAALLEAYGQYQTQVAQIGDSRSRAAQRQKAAVKQAYETTVLTLAGGPDRTTGVDNSLYPDLADLARGVFRLPD